MQNLQENLERSCLRVRCKHTLTFPLTAMTASFPLNLPLRRMDLAILLLFLSKEKQYNKATVSLSMRISPLMLTNGAIS